MRKATLLSLIASLVISAGGAASAQPLPADTLDREKRLTSFSPDRIDATMKVVTFNHHPAALENGQIIVSGYSTTGLQFSVLFHRCEGEGVSKCGALQLLTSWEAGESADATNAEVLRAAPKLPFVNLGVFPDGKPYVSRIVLAGNGISQANLAEEIEAFLAAASSFKVMLISPAAQ